jgi:TPR repeat protein
MKSLLLVFASLFLVQTLISQNYQTVEEVNDACSQLGFSGDEDAEIAVDKILDQIGLYRNFTIQECPDINNAVAKNIEISPGHKERYILYDATFFSRMDDKAGNDWAAVSILAHEIGHHLKGHALNNEGSNHQFEIESDNWSGWVLAKMGATLEESQSAIQTLRYEKATRTHPAKIDRLAAIKKGWNKGKGITISNTVDIELVEDEIIDEEEVVNDVISIKYIGNVPVLTKEIKELAEEKDEEELGEDEIVEVDDEAIEFYKKGEIEYQNFNYTEAIAHFEKAKELGSVDAYYYLSNFYYLGQGTKIDLAKAFRLADEGYKKGSIPATYQLGKYYANGFGVTKNMEIANRLFQKNFQIKWFKDQFDKTNSGFHAYTIGYMYGEGYGGVKENIKLSLSWYDKAVNLNNPIAQNNLGMFYELGDIVVKDYEKARVLYIKSAKQGLSIGQNNLGRIYENGYGIKKDYKEALKWFRKAAEQGNARGQTGVGRIYQYGYGVKKDSKEALKWYRKATEQGDSWGQFCIGFVYDNGYGVKKDYKEALKWYLMAAEQDLSSAQINLGHMYKKGKGVEKNKTTAMYWFRKATKPRD